MRISIGKMNDIFSGKSSIHGEFVDHRTGRMLETVSGVFSPTKWLGEMGGGKVGYIGTFRADGFENEDCVTVFLIIGLEDNKWQLQYCDAS